jgi:hypothetical protein
MAPRSSSSGCLRRRAVTASLRRPSKDENRAAIDRLPRRWEKCVNSAGDYIEWRTYVYTFRNINSIFI